MKRLNWVFLLLFFVGGRNAVAQESKATPRNFTYLRGGTTSSFYIFYTYDFLKPHIAGGTPLVVLASIIDPHSTDYREYLGGLGLNIAGSNNGILPFMVISKASDSWYTELLVFSYVIQGRQNLSAFTGLYLPTQTQGVYQFFVDPATLLIQINKWLAVGGSYTLFGGDGFASEHGIGPSVQFPIPLGTATVDLLKGIRNMDNDLRLTLQLTW